MANLPISPTADPLAAFLPATRRWFETTLGAPTPPQAQGWPAIQRGENTLILAPTGSGKTLTAFLWAIDRLFHKLSAEQNDPIQNPKSKTKNQESAIDVIYISPLKALNNDIERNLRTPLAGIRRNAGELRNDLPEIRVAVRSGDTPSKERQAMLRQPPHILITTPESFYLLLTSPNARILFRSVRSVIVDEIHTLAGSKRGVHLSLTLERLQHLAAQPIQRIGLSATIQPLEEMARYLVGCEQGRETRRPEDEAKQEGEVSENPNSLRPRPVTIVNAGYRKALDLQVVTVVEDFRNLSGDSIWPSIIPRITELIRAHKTTLVFVNDRRAAERTADRLNEQMAAEATEIDGQKEQEGPKSKTPNPKFNTLNAMLEGGVAKGLGLFATGTGAHPVLIPAHHGSVSRERRLAIEQDLKAGVLPALVGTSSLELGIDIGAVDLVVQIQSPKAVAQGLQRIGRAGHLVGQTSKGRIFPTHREDVMEAAAVAGGMLRGEVEPIHTPRNALDILAQQIVAMVSVENWQVDKLYDLVRQSYAYTDLTLRSFHVVLDMLSGRYPSQVHRELRPRIQWDRINNQLAALPGARLLALTNGGTITDRGVFSAYLPDGKTKLGELDEEFVYETRLGDTLMLGSQVWRVIELTDDRVIVANAAGATPRMPFWRGDYPWRPYELGRRVGAFRRSVAERLGRLRTELGLESCQAVLEQREEPLVQRLLAWLHNDYALDDNSTWQALGYVARQLDHIGTISSDRTILVELFEDALGDPRMVIQSPFGGKVNGLWAMALTSALRQRLKVEVEVQSNDDGILFRFPNADAAFPLDLVQELGVNEARERILLELPNSAVFGAHFRQNAGRALLLPGLGRGKRTPFWLQRLRAKDLLQVVKQLPDFPIIAETYRDCLEEVMDLPHLETVLAGIQRGEIQVEVVESFLPSPVAQSLLYDLIAIYMYEWDTPKAERHLQTLSLNRDLLQDLLKDVNLADLLRGEAVEGVRARLQRTLPAAQARTVEELASIFQELGDLSASEIALRCTVEPSSWVGQLAGAGRILTMQISAGQGWVERWIHAEYQAEYSALAQRETTTAQDERRDEALRRILDRFLAQAGPVSSAEIQARYAFPNGWLQAELLRRVEARQLAQGRFTPGKDEARSEEFIDLHTLEQMQRRTLTILRSEVQPSPFALYADFLARRQYLHPDHRLDGEGALRKVLQQLRAAPIVGPLWEGAVLPLRLKRYQPAELSALCQSGELVWVGSGGVDPRRGRIRFLFRGEGGAFLEPAPSEFAGLGESAPAIYNFLKSEGAVFTADLCTGLGIETSVAESGLLELALAGLVTNDSWMALQRLWRQGSSHGAASRQPVSSLEAELAARLGDRSAQLGGVRRPSRSKMLAARQRVNERIGRRLADTLESAAPPAHEGRWALVHRLGVLGKPLSLAEQAAQQARQLLARYGVVTHDSLANEIGAWQWSLIYAEMQRLELRGEVRRGYFVQGLPGVQFALPDVVEALRAAGSAAADQTDSPVLMNACDPANLYGATLAAAPRSINGEPLTFARIPSNWLALQRGLPILLVEEGSASVTTMQGCAEESIQQALAMWLKHWGAIEGRVTIEKWNGEPVLKSSGKALLEAAGFYRNYPAMTWER